MPVLITILGLILAGQVSAQTFTTLYSFTGDSDGANPLASLILSGNTLYGTARYSGSSYGTVFKVNTDGTDFAVLHSFTWSDGAQPVSGLILSGNALYGTTLEGGSSAEGTVFKVNTDGTDFTTLYSFMAIPTFPGPYTNSDGARPGGGLILSGNTLYGTADYGGSGGRGTIFAINTDGTGFTNLHNFPPIPVDPPLTNSDGANPGQLSLSGNTLYGTASYGGSGGRGTVFAINTDGTGFTNLHTFTAGGGNSSGDFTNSDGGGPNGGLILSENTLYGSAYSGGSSCCGTVFGVNVYGSGFTNLHSFGGSDGAGPQGGLILSGNTLYGMSWGGRSGPGTVFALATDGTGFTTLYSFTEMIANTNSDGAHPVAGLILSGHTLYGTSTSGGSWGYGTVFSIFIQPQLTITPSGQSVILKWPTNYDGFILQSTTNLVSPNWVTHSPAPVVVNGQNTVTNPISGAQQFFRLSQ